MAKVILKIIKGKLTGLEFVFGDRNTCIIGRNDDCYPQIPEDENHTEISRYHCLLDINPPQIMIRDFSSLNGTYLNSIKIGQRKKGETPTEGQNREYPQHILKKGDTFCLGKTETVFEVDIEEVISQTTVKINPPNENIGKPNLFGWINDFLERIRLGKTPQLNENAQFLAKYQLIKELGAGGFGKVYLARHMDTKKEVALKVMLPNVAQHPDMVQRFLREIECTKPLNHPNIVKMLDYGYAEGLFFFTLEYCNGGSVQDLMTQRKGKLSIEEAMGIIIPVLKGLEYAHQVKIENVELIDGNVGKAMGLVHRDLKPDNLLIDNSSSSPTVKIADFGLAKAFDLAGLSGLSITDGAIGTPYFMCRQQVLNFKYAKPDIDIWAIAATLYYLLTGGHVPRSFDQKDAFKCILSNQPIPIRQKNPDLPKSLADVIDLALQENPELHFKTARDFRKALESTVSIS